MPDEAAIRNAVLAAFESMVAAERPIDECYRAAVDAYRSFYPEAVREAAARRAVNIVLAARQGDLLRVE